MKVINILMLILFTMKKPFIFGPLRFNKYRVTISVETDEI